MNRPLLARVGALAVVVTLGAGLSACGKPERTAIKELRAAIARTERESYRFQYDELTNDGQSTEVRGLIADDFKFKVRLVRNGTPSVDEVVSDDVLADRFLDPAALKLLLRPGASPAQLAPGTDESAATVPGNGTAVQDVSAADAATTKRWLVDPVGAPSLFINPNERTKLGDDPIHDARTVFQYIEQVAHTMPVVKFNKDALEYRPAEDPFPRPQSGSGVTRYDFIRFPVPRPSDTRGGNQAVPSEQSFRKMSVYVKGGLIIRVEEQMDVASRLRDIKRNYGIKLTGSTRDQIDQAVAAINVVRKGQGSLNPIRVRRMSYRLTDLGKPQVVQLPPEYVVANLSALIGRGRTKTSASLVGGAAAGGGTTETTAQTTDTSSPPTSAP